jgi:hypothetical protein
MVAEMDILNTDAVLCHYTRYEQIPNIPFSYTPILTLSRDNSSEMMRFIQDLIPNPGRETLYWIRLLLTDGRQLTKIGYSMDVVRRLGYDYFRREPYSMMIDRIELHGLFFLELGLRQEQNWLTATRDLEIKPFQDSHRINTKEFRADFMENSDMQQHIWAFCQGLQYLHSCIMG